MVSSFFLRYLLSICFTQREREGPNHPVYMLYLYRSRLEATERGLVGLLGQVGVVPEHMMQEANLRGDRGGRGARSYREVGATQYWATMVP